MEDVDTAVVETAIALSIKPSVGPTLGLEPGEGRGQRVQTQLKEVGRGQTAVEKKEKFAGEGIHSGLWLIYENKCKLSSK